MRALVRGSTEPKAGNAVDGILDGFQAQTDPHWPGILGPDQYQVGSGQVFLAAGAVQAFPEPAAVLFGYQLFKRLIGQVGGRATEHVGNLGGHKSDAPLVIQFGDYRSL